MKRRRGALRLTQRSLAKAMGYADVYIRRVESGERKPSGPLLQKLAQHLQIPAELRDAFLTFAKTGKYDRRLDGLLGDIDALDLHLSSPSNNLPTPPTTLVGREQEVASLRRILLRPDTRVITLVGAGGTGKTRVALQLASDVLDHFTGGVWFVDLAPITDPTLVASAIARPLGVRQQGKRRLEDSIMDALQERVALLILDNFEQLLPLPGSDTADAGRRLVADLISHCPRLKIIVTSRERLNIRGERRFEIPPLALPNLDGSFNLTQLAQTESVCLFIDRAQDVKPDFELTSRNALAIARLCRLLDGLPLAIEIAAPRLLDFTPDAMLDELTRSGLTFLTGGAIDLPDRQQTMRATIAWSYRLLNAWEQTLFQRLGVFVGGCTLAAVEAVVDTPPSSVSLQSALQSLTDKNLVRWTETATSQRRLWLPETIREFAREQLLPAESRPLRQRHALYCLHLAEIERNHTVGPELAPSLQRLDDEFPNLRAALEWYESEAEDVKPGLKLASALWQYWYLRGDPTESRARLDKLLARETKDISNARAHTLQIAGALAYNQCDFTAAENLYQQALAAWRAIDEHPGLSRVLNNLGVLAREQGQFALAKQYFEEALQVSEAHDIPLLGAAHANLGAVALRQGELATALSHYELAVQLLTQVSQDYLLAYCYLGLGRLEDQRGAQTEAREYFAQSLMLAYHLKDRRSIAAGLEGLGIFLARRRHGEQAIQLLGAAETIRHSIGQPLPPADESDVYTAIDALRVMLRPKAFEAAYQKGRQLTIDAAVQLALQV